MYIYNLLWQYWWYNHEHNYEFTTRKTHKEGTQNVNLSLSTSNLSIGETCMVELSHHGILSWNTFKVASRRFHPLLCKPLLIFHETICKMLTNHKAKSIGKEFQKDVGCLDFQHSILCKMDHCTTLNLLLFETIHLLIRFDVLGQACWCHRFLELQFFSNLILVWVLSAHNLKKIWNQNWVVKWYQSTLCFLCLQKYTKIYAVYLRSYKWSTKSNISNLSFHIL